ncbi:MAG: hypothetical protein R3B95_11445 [Nitrospirales bacterium]|nr:hypothetical protein [Nitrospirales bacterium]
MPGFTAPGLLFLGTVSQTEKFFLSRVFEAAKLAGFRRFIEPAAGAFAMSCLAVQQGWEASTIHTSDISFFSCVFGRAITNQPLAPLAIQIHEPLLGEVRVERPADVMWADLVCRYLVKASRSRYWEEIVRDMVARKAEIIEKIEEQIKEGRHVLGGMQFEGRCLFSHLAQVLDDKETIVSLLPPTISKGFEKFFDTGGRITWQGPEYRVFDPKTVKAELRETFEKAKATVILYEQAVEGDTILSPVYVKVGVGKTSKDTGGLRSVNLYFESNDPERVEAWAHGPKIVRKEGVLKAGGWDLPPNDMEFTEDLLVKVVPMKREEVFYWRALWTHRFRPSVGIDGLGVVVGPWLVGVMGYNVEHLTAGAYGKVEDSVLLQFGMTSKVNGWRLGRLLWKLSRQESVIAMAMNGFENKDLYLGKIRVVRTGTFSPYPESKEMRGIFKLINRVKMTKPEYGVKDGYRLTYEATIERMTEQEVYAWWRTKERTYQQHKTATS